MMVGAACSGSSTPPMPTPPQVHVLADLRAGTDRGPGIHHRAAVDVGADVDETRHQHHVRSDIGALAHDGVRHHADARGADGGLADVRILERHLVEKTRVAGFDGAIVVRPEIKQHRLLQPVMYDPPAVDFFRDPRLAAV